MPDQYMIYTIISGSNRQGSYTEKVAEIYYQLLKQRNVKATILSLKNVDVLNRTPGFLQIENEILIPTDKFIFIVPEYNGTFPGILKAMIDNTDIRKVWYHKKALLTGVSIGRAGNLRGMDHLAASLNFMKVHVHHNKLPISVIDRVMDANGKLNDETMEVINEQLDEFINY